MTTTNAPNYIHTNVHKINRPIQDITPQRILDISGFRGGESSHFFFYLWHHVVGYDLQTLRRKARSTFSLLLP
jgi:hypothetical protein